MLAPTADVDFNHFYRPQAGAAQTDCRGQGCVAFELVGWPVGADRDGCGAGLRIGMVDTGVNAAHETFRGQNIEVVAFKAGGEESSETHGTAVAALLVGSPASRSPGLLPAATLVAVDPFRRDSAGELATAFDLALALDHLAVRDVTVVNMSLSGPPNAVFARIVQRLSAENVLLVASVGNEGPAAAPTYPASYGGVLGVSAVDAAKRLYRRAGRGPQVDFVAPGVNVWTAASKSGAKPRTGTSFATPFVSAVAALAAADGRLAGYESVKAKLAREALDLGAEGRDDLFGHGLVQLDSNCLVD